MADKPLEPSATDALVRRSRDGGDGLTALYEHLAPALYAWARLRISPALRTRFEPEDLVQEVWWKALDAFDTYDSAKGSFRAWIFTIATRVLISGFRRAGRAAAGQDRQRAAIPAEATAISQRVARNEILGRVIAAVQLLDATDRDIFVHCGLEGMSAPAAARLIGVTPDAAAKRWQRLRAHVRGEIPDGALLFEEA